MLHFVKNHPIKTIFAGAAVAFSLYAMWDTPDPDDYTITVNNGQLRIEKKENNSTGGKQNEIKNLSPL